MAKSTTTITLDTRILEAHRKAGSNISGLCNEFLGNYFQKEGQTLIEKADFQAKATKEVIHYAQDTAKKDSLLQRLLERARKMRATGGDLKKTLDEAEKVSGLPRAEIVRKL